MKAQSGIAYPLALLALLAAASGCGLHGRPKVERKARPVQPSQNALPKASAATSVSPSKADDPASDVVIAPGIVEPWADSVNLSAQESGWIAHIHVNEGQWVEIGQVLAELEDTSLRYGVDLARAELSESEAALAKTLRGATAEELRQAESEANAAAVRSELARSTAARAARLNAAKAVADSEAERTADEARAEAARADGAEARRLAVQRGARAEERKGAFASVAAARARLALAEAALARRRVLAPIRGTILLSRFHAGEFYNVGAGPILVLGDITRLQVRLEVDEIDAQDLKAGSPCAFFSDGGERLTEGTVSRLAPRMGRRVLPIESPTARSDIRVREVVVEIAGNSSFIPGQRVWGHAARNSGLAIVSQHIGDKP